ncbi:MAG: hypothetical protein VW803_02605 [Aquiluna sp.]
MKRPWLTTPRGQQITMWLGVLVSLLALVPLNTQLELDQKRATIEQFELASIQYCEVASCGQLKIAGGLEITSELTLEENEFGVNAKLRVINHGMALGDREFWFELRSEGGQRVESMRGQLSLTPKGPQFIEFFFTGTKAEFECANLILGY